MAEIDFSGVIEGYATSWIFVVLFAEFFLVCFRVKGNFKFVGTLFRDLAEVRERENLFDSTVRETSLIFFSLLLTGCSAGVLLRHAVPLCSGLNMLKSEIPDLGGLINSDPAITGACMILSCLYIGAMWMCYTIVGRVFSDNLHTWLWVRGFTAGTGLGAAVFFPLALLVLIYPQFTLPITLTALGMLILLKIIFIVKGFRIFFTESAFWVVFLYYLCSLEIVPLVITFSLASSLLG